MVECAAISARQQGELQGNVLVYNDTRDAGIRDNFTGKENSRQLQEHIEEESNRY